MDIFVRNLSKEVEEQDLRQIFEPYGSVETVTLVTDKETGRRVGFGFVGMPSNDEAIFRYQRAQRGSPQRSDPGIPGL